MTYHNSPNRWRLTDIAVVIAIARWLYIKELGKAHGILLMCTVGLQYLKSCSYLPQECEQMQSLCDRISRVYSSTLEDTVKNLLQSLGKLNRPDLTVVEEKLLGLIEREYGSGD